MKKLISVILALITAFSFSAVAFADVAPPAPPSPPGIDCPEIPDYSGTYYVSNTDGAPVYAGSEFIPTGKVIPHSAKVEVALGYEMNGETYLAGTYNNTPVIVNRDDMSTHIVRPQGYNNPGITVFAYSKLEIIYKESSGLGVLKSGMVYESSDEDIVSVSQNGVATATGEGSAYIKATDPKTGEYDVIRIDVTFTWWQKFIRTFLFGFLWY